MNVLLGLTKGGNSVGGLERRIEELEARVAALERCIPVEHAEHEELEALKEELSKPVERTPEEVAKALSIVGIGEGPRDLSRNFRKYLRGEKR
ncbi:MAG: hypothetical protein H5T84_00795 [Thermoleophilia bacterium]|nr:hypothetical protein [Thermoleophilia bacterium]